MSGERFLTRRDVNAEIAKQMVAQKAQPKPSLFGLAQKYAGGAWDEAKGAFEAYGNRSGAQRRSSMDLLNRAGDPGQDPMTGAGMKLLGLAGLATSPLAFFPTEEEWKQRVGSVGGTDRVSQSFAGMMGAIPSIIDPQLLAGGGVLAAAPLIGKLNKAGHVADDLSGIGKAVDLPGGAQKDMVWANGRYMTRDDPDAPPWVRPWTDEEKAATENVMQQHLREQDAYQAERLSRMTPIERASWEANIESLKNQHGFGRKPRTGLAEDGPVPSGGGYASMLKSLGPEYEGATVFGHDGKVLHGADNAKVGGPSVLINADGSHSVGITAYHGSPHSFDKFSTGNIGTGEGAQAYGHGLYFADSEGVAKSYRDSLSALNVTHGVDGTPISPTLQNMLTDARQDLTGSTHGVTRGGMVDLVDAKLKRQAQDAAKAKDFEWYGRVMDLNAELHRTAKTIPVGNGSMYQVHLDVKPHELLDWDKPLSEQSGTQDILRKAGLVGDNKAAVVAARNNAYADFDAGKISREERNKRIDAAGHHVSDVGLGADVYNGLTEGGKTTHDIQGAATAKLKAAGIKGIRYKDAGSRDGSGGTYNYVIFDDKLITILKKYGIPMTAGAGGAMMVSGQHMPPDIAAQMGGT